MDEPVFFLRSCSLRERAPAKKLVCSTCHPRRCSVMPRALWRDSYWFSARKRARRRYWSVTSLMRVNSNSRRFTLRSRVFAHFRRQLYCIQNNGDFWRTRAQMDSVPRRGRTESGWVGFRSYTRGIRRNPLDDHLSLADTLNEKELQWEFIVVPLQKQPCYKSCDIRNAQPEPYSMSDSSWASARTLLNLHCLRLPIFY